MAKSNAQRQREFRQRKRIKDALGEGGDNYASYKIIADEWEAKGLSKKELANLVQAKFVTLVPRMEDASRLANAGVNIMAVVDAADVHTEQSAKAATTLLLLNGCTCGVGDRLLSKLEDEGVE